jgi:diguanylate cyclase (GGDEF)-like protein
VEFALPHIIVRIYCGPGVEPGVGPDLVAALGVHPVEVTEVRDHHEARRAAGGRPPILVVVTDPPNLRAAVAATWSEFPQTPILIVGNSTAGPDTREPPLSMEATERGGVDTISASLPLTNICWHVLEAVGRAALLPGATERLLGPVFMEVDDRGNVLSSAVGIDQLLIDGRRLRIGQSLLPLIEPRDRDDFTRMLEQPQVGAARFSTARLIGEHGCGHTASVGMRRLGAGRVGLLFQPLIPDGPILGRHINNRDPITGLFTRWAISRLLEESEEAGEMGRGPTLLMLKMDNFRTVSEHIGSRTTDTILVRVASILGQILPYSAVSSRLMGDTFLTFLPDMGVEEAIDRGRQVIEAVNGIDVPAVASDFKLRASIGISGEVLADHDLALRLAEAAVTAARADGGNRVVVAKPPFTPAWAAEFAAEMERGTWEVWLQPVATQVGGQAAFHESLARFGNGHGHLVSRPEFFTTGRANGLLERFDRMMLQRCLQILEAHPDARLSVNISYETFASNAFPDSVLELIREVPDSRRRIILEIAPRCLMVPAIDARSRLEALAAAGVVVAIDDFGSGICRLHHLTQFPLAMVKLDELVTGYVDDDPLQREFARVVAGLCHARGITTVAEFTRSPEQLTRLLEDGVDLFQGELLGMPAPAARVLGESGISRVVPT